MSVHQVQLPPDMPREMRLRLKRMPDGRPIPFFVEWVEGPDGKRTPDFRIMSHSNLHRAIRQKLCWVCGGPMSGGVGTFVAGPMCVINRTSAEPPSHRDCAVWSAKACPFLTKPGKTRRESNMPEATAEVPGIMIARNPGVTALIESTWWRAWSPAVEMGIGGKGLLWNFHIESVHWMAEGRDATPREILDSVEAGVPALSEAALTQGPEAEAALAVQLAGALGDWFPDISQFPAAEFPNTMAALGL